MRTYAPVAVLVAVIAASGCAARQDRLANRFIKPGVPTTSFDGVARKPPAEDLHEYSRKVRELQSRAAPKNSLLPTIESRDPELSKALLQLAIFETAENHRRVAAAYRRAGITDYAFRHLHRALRLEPCDSLAYEGMAQMWRDAGLPELALGDSYRALACRPNSASGLNTLGTVFQALGQAENARRAFNEALRVDTQAVFALNNLCYLSIQEGNGPAAEAACRRALTMEPGLTASRNNLALAFALQGRIVDAEAGLLESPDRAEGQYNVGILRMALGNFQDAAAAFDLAASERPSLWEAARRAVQARVLAAQNREP